MLLVLLFVLRFVIILNIFCFDFISGRKSGAQEYPIFCPWSLYLAYYDGFESIWSLILSFVPVFV